MAAKSSIKRLPKALLQRLDALIAADELTLDDLTAWLDDKGHRRSRSALGRYAKDIRKVAGEIERSTQIAQAVVAELGPAAAEGKTGRLLVSILQKLIFDHLMARIDGGEGFAADEFYKLTRAVRELFMGLGLDAEREARLKRDTAAKAAKVATAAGRKAGLSAETIAAIERDVLGIAA